MKKNKVLWIVAFIALLLGCIINLVNSHINTSPIWSICAIVLFITSLILNGIAWKKQTKNSPKNDNGDQ